MQSADDDGDDVLTATMSRYEKIGVWSVVRRLLLLLLPGTMSLQEVRTLPLDNNTTLLQIHIPVLLNAEYSVGCRGTPSIQQSGQREPAAVTVLDCPPARSFTHLCDPIGASL